MSSKKRSKVEQSSEKFTSNEVLVTEKKDMTVYYIPCYCRLKVKKVNDLQFSGMQGLINTTLLFGIYYGDLPQHILEQFTGSGSHPIVLQFPKQTAIELKRDKEVTVKTYPKDRMIDYVVRK